MLLMKFMIILLSGNSFRTNTNITIVLSQLGLTHHFLSDGGSIKVEGIDGDNQDEVDAFFELVDNV